MSYYIILYHIVFFYYSILYHILLYYIILYSIILYYILLYYIILYYIFLYYIILYFILLYMHISTYDMIKHDKLVSYDLTCSTNSMLYETHLVWRSLELKSCKIQVSVDLDCKCHMFAMTRARQLLQTYCLHHHICTAYTHLPCFPLRMYVVCLVGAWQLCRAALLTLRRINAMQATKASIVDFAFLDIFQ